MSEQAYDFVATNTSVSVEYKQQNTSVSLYNIILSRQSLFKHFVVASILLSREKTCVVKLLSRQK